MQSTLECIVVPAASSTSNDSRLLVDLEVRLDGDAATITEQQLADIATALEALFASSAADLTSSLQQTAALEGMQLCDEQGNALSTLVFDTNSDPDLVLAVDAAAPASDQAALDTLLAAYSNTTLLEELVDAKLLAASLNTLVSLDGIEFDVEPEAQASSAGQCAGVTALKAAVAVLAALLACLTTLLLLLLLYKGRGTQFVLRGVGGADAHLLLSDTPQRRALLAALNVYFSQTGGSVQWKGCLDDKDRTVPHPPRPTSSGGGSMSSGSMSDDAVTSKPGLAAEDSGRIQAWMSPPPAAVKGSPSKGAGRPKDAPAAPPRAAPTWERFDAVLSVQGVSRSRMPAFRDLLKALMKDPTLVQRATAEASQWQAPAADVEHGGGNSAGSVCYGASKTATGGIKAPAAVTDAYHPIAPHHDIHYMGAEDMSTRKKRRKVAAADGSSTQPMSTNAQQQHSSPLNAGGDGDASRLSAALQGRVAAGIRGPADAGRAPATAARNSDSNLADRLPNGGGGGVNGGISRWATSIHKPPSAASSFGSNASGRGRHTSHVLPLVE